MLDPTTLADLLAATGDDPELVGELVDRFLEDSRRFVAAMGHAIDADDTEGLRQAAAALGSVASSIGATAMAEQCRVLEDLAATGVLDGAADRLTEARRTLADTSDAFDDARLEDWELA